MYARLLLYQHGTLEADLRSTQKLAMLTELELWPISTSVAYWRNINTTFASFSAGYFILSAHESCELEKLHFYPIL